MDCFSLKGKVAIITGGISGIGKSIALAMAESGATPVLVDIREPSDNSLIEQIGAMGRETMFVQADVSREKDVAHFVNETVKRFGHVDIQVNCAGILVKAPVEQLTEAEWDSVLDVNLKGTFLCCKQAGIQMIAQQSGAIVNMASMSAYIVNKHRTCAPYSASKAGVSMLTKNLAMEWAKHNIRANAIAPGYIFTPLNAWMVKGAKGSEYIPVAMDLTPMNRFGQPEEIASVAVFLASSGASFMTGQTLIVDGGYTIW